MELGNIDAKRDWGHAKDYVEGMWMMMQKEIPDDYVLATNETHSVREFVEKAFNRVGVEIAWKGSGVAEVGYEKDTGIVRVKINPKHYRRTEVDFLLGDATKAKRALGWEPKIKFEALVKEMIDADVAVLKKNPNA